MSHGISTLLVLLVGLLPTAANAAETVQEKMQREAGEKKMERIKEDLKRRDVAIQFYGKVLDQSDQPVEGVEVALHVTQFSPDEKNGFSQTRPIRVQTDAQGRFTVTQQRGFGLYVEGLRKEGYESLLREGPERGYDYAAYSKLRFIPDKDNPIVFHMRKTGAATFLLQDGSFGFQIPSAKSGDTVGYDFVQRRKVWDDKTTDTSPQLVRDFQVKALFNADNATWTVTLSSGTPNGGIMVSQQALYEGPETGYQAEYTFTPEDRQPGKAKYIYLRSRDPAIYTRIEIRDIVASKTFFELAASSVTNPYGDRNLEQAPNLPFELKKRLTDDAKAAFSRNKRPARPDLPKMIQEAKDKAEKAKAEKDKARQGAAGGQP